MATTTAYTNIVGQCATAITGTANRYNAPTSVVGAFGTTATGAGCFIVVPGNAQTYTFDTLAWEQDTAIGATFTRTIAVQVDGVDTTLTTTIAGAAQVANTNTSSSFTAVSGQKIGIRTSADTTTSTGTMRWSFRATCTTNKNMSCAAGTATTVSASATNYLPIQSFQQSATASDVEQIMPNAGTFQNTQLILSNTPTNTYTFTLMKNTVATAIVLTITGAATTATDTANTVTYVQGDRFYWQCVPTATPIARSVFISMETVPTVQGESVHLQGSASAWLNSAVRYEAVSHPGGVGHGTTESSRQVISQPAVWKKLTTYNATAAGAGKSYLIQLTKEGTAGNPSVTVGNTTGTSTDNTNTITTVLGDSISLTMTPSGTPTTTIGEMSVVSYIASNTLSFGWKVRAEPNSSGTQTHITQPTVPWNAGQQNDYFIEGIYEPKDI